MSLKIETNAETTPGIALIFQTVLLTITLVSYIELSIFSSWWFTKRPKEKMSVRTREEKRWKGKRDLHHR